MREEPGTGAWPGVSVVMPVLNEGPHLADAVTAVLQQDYPGALEVVLAVGPSRDDTGDIAESLAAREGRVRVVHNASGRTPVALNAAVRSSVHPVIVRADGHSRLPDGYIRTAVTLLRETGADNVGGMMVPEGRTAFEQAVARAMSVRIGIGGAPFHVGGRSGPAETVYLGVFLRDCLERLGGFDESLDRAQDWELNHRIRSSGGLVWFSPDLRVTYRPRSSWRALATQFYRTGQWRRQVMRRYPGTASLRYLAPPAAVCVVGSASVVALAGVVTGSALVWAVVVPAGYVAALLIATPFEGRGLTRSGLMWFPAVVAIMHACWGTGFLFGRTVAFTVSSSGRLDP